jgi:hypothetical protein
VRDAALLAAGIASLGLAAGLSAVAGPRERAALPASLGATRALFVDALFLKAEALRDQGRLDEVPGLYRRILDVDPDNEAAVDYLADVLARDLRPTAATPAGRVRWWTAARDLVAAGLARRPDSARLHFRMGDLLTRLPASDPDVRAHLAAEGRDADGLALDHLARAARLSGSLPKWGFLHLDALARLAPRVAADRLARGAPGVDDALAAGDALLASRGAELFEFLLDVEPPIAARDRLDAALRLVRSVRRALAADPPDRVAARRFLEAYETHVTVDPVSRTLRAHVR